MNFQSEGQVLGAESYNIDGNPIGYLHILNDEDPDNPAHIGQIPSKVNCSPNVIEKLRQMKLPATVTLSMTTQKGGQGKTAMYVKDIQKAAQQPSQAKTS